MPVLNEQNSTIQKESGAVIFHKSPELLELIELKQEVKNLNNKMDEILNLLKGGEVNGKKMD